MAATCVYPDPQLRVVPESTAQKNVVLVPTSETCFSSPESSDSNVADVRAAKQRDSFLVVMLRALGSPHS
jgi:hypothetical protein